MPPRVCVVLAFIPLTGVWLTPSAPHAMPTFTGLGQLPGREASFATGVSDDGLVVVGSGYRLFGPRSSEAFRWTSGEGMVGLGSCPGGGGSAATGTSADGSVIVGRCRGLDHFTPGPTDGEAFRWTSGTGMISLGDLPGGRVDSYAYGVSGDGDVVVGYSQSSWSGGMEGVEAFRWTPDGGMVRMGPGFQAFAASEDGSVVAGFGPGPASGPFGWTEAGGWFYLGDFPGGPPYGGAWDVSADGLTIVGGSDYAELPPADMYSNPTVLREAFRWTPEGGMVGLGHLFFPSTEALGVSADGSTIVGQAGQWGRRPFAHPPHFSRGYGKAFIWDASNGMRDLNFVLIAQGLGAELSGWTLTSAYDVSADGLTIVGEGVNPGGQYEGWIATIPEPKAGLLLGSAIAALAALRKRHSLA